MNDKFSATIRSCRSKLMVIWLLSYPPLVVKSTAKYGFKRCFGNFWTEKSNHFLSEGYIVKVKQKYLYVGGGLFYFLVLKLHLSLHPQLNGVFYHNFAFPPPPPPFGGEEENSTLLI